MKTVLKDKSYVSSLDEVVRIIKNRKVDLGVRHILIVPDVYTFMLEKRLFGDGVGSFDVEVTTFNRLYSRVAQSREALSKQGAIMLLKKICLENADKLTCYSRSAQKTGFAVKLYDAISKLRSCAVTPDELKNAKNLKKANDIALLYELYEREIEGKYVDAGGRIALLKEYFESSNYLSDCHVYIALYDILPRQVELLLSVVEKKALSLTVSGVLPNEGYKTNARMRIFGCADRVNQYKAVAKRIREYVSIEGNRYGDIVVVDENADSSVASRIFHEYGVPYYANEKLALVNTELARFLLQAVNAKLRAYKTEDMLALSQNRYFDFDKDERDEFTNFVNCRSVDYLGFTRPFDGEGSEKAEKVRKSLMKIVDAVSDSTTASQFFDSLLYIVSEVNAKEKTAQLALVDGREIESVYDKTIELISMAKALFGGTIIPAEELLSTLEEGFKGTEISLVPNRRDTVQIGALALTRGSRVKLAIVVDFNDGVLPVVNYDDGLISDLDADEMEEYKIKIEPRAKKTNELCRDELWHFLKSADELFITYSQADGSKPSYDLRLLSQVNGVEMLSYEECEQLLKRESDPIKIAKGLGSYLGATEYALVEESVPFISSLRKVVGAQSFSVEAPEKPFTKDQKRIFLRSKRTSVSALQTYFDCPYKYFLSYALRVKKLEDGKVTPIDIGLMLHKIAERFVNEGLPKDVKSFVEKEIPLLLSKYEKYNYKNNERIFKRLLVEAEKICSIIAYQIESGLFVPYKTECSFGKEDSVLDTITYPSGVTLNGEIDRIDLYGDYARVIDYKTGTIKFDYNDLYFGRKIQLMIYMQVLIKNGYKPAGLFYFPSVVSWRDDEFSHRLRGAYCVDGELLTAQDESLIQPVKSKVIEITMKESKAGLFWHGNQMASTSDELYAMCAYAEKVAGRAIEEILGGNATPSPASKKKGSACDYCDYRAVCSENKITRNTDGAKKKAVTECE